MRLMKGTLSADLWEFRNLPQSQSGYTRKADDKLWDLTCTNCAHHLSFVYFRGYVGGVVNRHSWMIDSLLLRLTVECYILWGKKCMSQNLMCHRKRWEISSGWMDEFRKCDFICGLLDFRSEAQVFAVLSNRQTKWKCTKPHSHFLFR